MRLLILLIAVMLVGCGKNVQYITPTDTIVISSKWSAEKIEAIMAGGELWNSSVSEIAKVKFVISDQNPQIVLDKSLNEMCYTDYFFDKKPVITCAENATDKLFAHELGHAMGIIDHNEKNPDSIMAAIVMPESFIDSDDQKNLITKWSAVK